MTEAIKPTRNLTTSNYAEISVTFDKADGDVVLSTEDFCWDRADLKELITFLKEVRKSLKDEE